MYKAPATARSKQGRCTQPYHCTEGPHVCIIGETTI